MLCCQGEFTNEHTNDPCKLHVREHIPAPSQQTRITFPCAYKHFLFMNDCFVVGGGLTRPGEPVGMGPASWRGRQLRRLRVLVPLPHYKSISVVATVPCLRFSAGYMC